MKIEVGGVYKSRNGDRVEIVQDDLLDSWPMHGDNGQFYERDGTWGSSESGHDLIALWDDNLTCEQTRPVTLLTEIDALAEKHNLTVLECSVSDGIYTLTIGGD